MSTYTPQDAAAISGLSLPAVQKAITARHIPSRLDGRPPRRRVTDLAVMALAMTRCLPKGLRLTPTEAYALLKRSGFKDAAEITGHVTLGSVRIDLPEALSKALNRLRTLDRAHTLLNAPNLRLSTLIDRLRGGDAIEALQPDYPLLMREDIEAIELWVQTNPKRGRPKTPIAVDRPRQPAPQDVSTWARTMQITAQQIDRWAQTRRGQEALPRFVRRLIQATSSVTKSAFPAGESITLPGWDGQLVAGGSTAWVPAGTSFWEFSCQDAPTAKASRDFKKRTAATPKSVRNKSTLVIVTGRRWPQKGKWLKTKSKEGKWREVRAYDADDVEQWLEQTPAIALQFADELGLTGQGIESPHRYWEAWAGQSDPAITHEALIAGRTDTRVAFLAAIRKRLDSSAGPLAIRADSVEEAAAFASSALLSDPSLSSVALVVTDPTGWRFVEKNPLVKIAVAARPEFAERPAVREGLVIVIPYAAGDMAEQFRGAAARNGAPDVILSRPKIDEFEKALKQIGIAEGDTRRLATIMGRSWSVFRRRRATNPAIRKPEWVDSPHAQVLSTVCLVGAWSQDKAADTALIERIAGRPYEETERELRELAQLDDAPVLMIGHAWKAKSPLELLDLFGKRITRAELDRYMSVVREILTASDPELELPEEQRYAAGIYGKVRAESGLLFHSLCDTLIKLAVRGSDIPGLAALDVENRVSIFVRDLLRDADETRWLSLSSMLPALAEAAPNAFLDAVETSLSRQGAPVLRLLTETSSSGIMGRCWHAGLLWALETLAWAPERLSRIASILARLSHTQIKGNWGNTPQATLLDLFRSWCPQTGAKLEQRIAALDTLIARDADVAFKLLDRLANTGADTATPSARPHWRDDDAGAGAVVKSNAEMYGMLTAAADRLITCAEGHPKRVAKLVHKVDQFDPPRVRSIIALIQRLTKQGVADSDREDVRSALRDKIHWHRNYGDSKPPALACLPELETIYEALAPDDLIARHRWMFASDWPDFPDRAPRSDFQARQDLVATHRARALNEVIDRSGLPGVAALALSCPGTANVGMTLGQMGIDAGKLAGWIIENSRDFSAGDPFRATVIGLLRSGSVALSTSIIELVLKHGQHDRWDNSKIAKFLSLARDERTTWEIARKLGPDLESAYWSVCTPGFWIRDDKSGLEFALQKLTSAYRPRTALQVCHMDFKTIDSRLLADLLEGVLRGEEPDGPLLSSWDLAQAIDALERSSAVARHRLVQLEFGLVPLLGFQGEQHTKILTEEIMSKPELFVELLCLVYMPANKTARGPASEEKKATAQIAWRILRGCHRQPGTRSNGTIEASQFARFVDTARELALKSERLVVCDVTLGEILAHAPADADGTWPCAPVRDVLDRPDSNDMRRGFVTGVFNKRGVTSRSYDEGGSQERGLAQTYRGYASALENSHPKVAATLNEIAQGYDREADRHDIDARLRIEGH